jgi:hypothetical protein
MSTINAEWHKANRMPANATLDQRVAWHLAHWEACRCRSTLPGTIVEELKRRGVKVPAAAPTKRDGNERTAARRR